MSNPLKRQVCYALGTLSGWGLARATNAKELVPFTIIGGLLGFAVSEAIYPESKGCIGPVRTLAPVDKKGELSGTKPGRSKRKTTGRTAKKRRA